MKNTVRIIGGHFRGKKISFPDVEGLRPTPDRVKETLFNWLMNSLHGKRCLDAFAGSGSLGFEALSRGAAHVVFVESAKPVFEQLRKTADSISANGIEIIHDDTRHYLKHCKEAFDLIFLDPPFASRLQEECIDIIAKNRILAPGGLLYVESPEPLNLNNTQWVVLKNKQAGQVIFSLYERL
ncbi:putative methylase [Legionella quinlivanii]|uniref:Ribosomal RNA small subunit methyltransferase D n=1 Tax=Legionella quinlivanii TaxID=45073 RepID=A0A0W0Y012_9GAMM|nr:16S rRNA (guanine(966)-N(2))-methyltransferase RsmD [Legionella quinlivanii]KTD50381.1 putative methylase [Legionella quinlivanii]SEF41752.1 16S rRNA (guanine966-N2)-methyltransferase [Legionella quinlivanii DSM 21216]STY11981.1 putative methylase [Legionella quinlivanii]